MPARKFYGSEVKTIFFQDPNCDPAVIQREFFQSKLQYPRKKFTREHLCEKNQMYIWKLRLAFIQMLWKNTTNHVNLPAII